MNDPKSTSSDSSKKPSDTPPEKEAKRSKGDELLMRILHGRRGVPMVVEPTRDGLGYGEDSPEDSE
jgi:hypothetical protein